MESEFTFFRNFDMSHREYDKTIKIICLLSAWKRVGFLATQKVHSEAYSDWTTAQAD